MLLPFALGLSLAHSPTLISDSECAIPQVCLCACLAPQIRGDFHDTDQPKVTPVTAVQASWISFSPISSPHLTVSEPTWLWASALGQRLAGGSRTVDDWRPGENLSSLSVGVGTQPILYKDGTSTMLE